MKDGGRAHPRRRRTRWWFAKLELVEPEERGGWKTSGYGGEYSGTTSSSSSSSFPFGVEGGRVEVGDLENERETKLNLTSFERKKDNRDAPQPD